MGWETAHVVFDAAELKLPLLGCMVENTVLQQALWQALEAHPKVTLRVPTSLIAQHRHNDLQELELKGGETILAKLVIGADGANSQCDRWRELAFMRQYAQSCMLTVQCENDPGDSTGSNLPRMDRVRFCRCLITGHRWCGMTLRRAFASCRI